MSNLPTIKVSAGIIQNEFGQIYINERLEGKDFGQSLEFAGGKAFDGETLFQTLQRELEEELGIHVDEATLFTEYSFEYPHKIIHFTFFLVKNWTGEPFGREGQRGFWINPQDLDPTQFPPVTEKVIHQIKSQLI